MPAPNRRNVGASLAERGGYARTPRERVAAAREGAARRFERAEAAGARPAPGPVAVDRSAWERALARGCHHAPAGEPCFDLPRGLCGARVRGAAR